MAIRPSKDIIDHLVWIARALSNSNSNPEHPSCILIQYFRPMLRNKNVEKFYIGWDFGNGLRWKVDPTNEEVWESTNSIFIAWKLNTRKETPY